MHIIDHAIQIPVAPYNMWALISNPENNPKWQADCRAVSLLNSVRRGIGMRWRSQAVRGKDQVIEVTAWYEGLGFEYTIVDGTRFTSNKGRLRLQEVPEGTIVQWTFTYELSGVLSGLRNVLSVRRSLDQNIVESLRNLFRVAKEQYKEADLTDSKVLMKDAPNVIERANYKPRYPSVLEEGKPRPSSTTPSREIPAVPASAAPPDAIFQRPTGPVSIAEPPVAEDDTRPNPILARTAAALGGAASLQMPSFSSASASQPEGAASDTTSKPVTNPAPSPLEALPTPMKAETSDPAPVSASAVPAAPEADAPPALATTVEPTDSPKFIEPPLRSSDSARLDKRDTATISVFELFGLPRPSMTQQMAAVTSAPTEAAPDSAPPIPSDAPIILSEPLVVPTHETTEPTFEPPSAEEAPLFASVETPVETPTVLPLPTTMPIDTLPFDSSDVPIAPLSSTANITASEPVPLPDTSSLKRLGLRRRLRRQLVNVRSAQ